MFSMSNFAVVTAVVCALHKYSCFLIEAAALQLFGIILAIMLSIGFTVILLLVVILLILNRKISGMDMPYINYTVLPIIRVLMFTMSPLLFSYK